MTGLRIRPNSLSCEGALGGFELDLESIRIDVFGPPVYNDAVIAIMIEKRAAVENLEEILRVPGIDMVQLGPGRVRDKCW